jgi:hypothetical protein
MIEDMVAIDDVDFSTPGREISLVEMGRDDLTVSCTQGKIILWFGRQVTEPLIEDIVFGISDIDSTVRHEHEVICDFNKISDYENKGYILTSYAKTRGGYRAIFNVPFSKRPALYYFIKTIVNQLKEKDVKKTLFWDGSPHRIAQLYNEFKKLDRWEIKRVEYKTEEQKGV